MELLLGCSSKQNWYNLGKWTWIDAEVPVGHNGTGTLYNGELYLMGGYFGEFAKKIYKYNPVTNIFSLVTDAENVPFMFTSEVHAYDGKLYMFGCYGEIATVVYNLSNGMAYHLNSANLSFAVSEAYFTSERVGNKVYIFGGYSGANNVAMLDMETLNTSIVCTDFPEHSAYCRSVAVGNDIYVLGGTNTSDLHVPNNLATKFNTITNTWTALPNIPGQLALNGIVSKINDEAIAYFAGYINNPGYTGSIEGTNVVKVYNFITNEWKAVNEVTPALFTNEIYIDTPTGIYVTAGYASNSRVYKYTK